MLVDRRALIVLAAAAAGLVIALVPPPAGAPPKALMALGLATVTVILWGTQAIPQPLAAVIFMALLLVTGTGTIRTVMAGVGSDVGWRGAS
jgi:di/tricarboxylate transporter